MQEPLDESAHVELKEEWEGKPAFHSSYGVCPVVHVNEWGSATILVNESNGIGYVVKQVPLSELQKLSLFQSS